MYTRITRHTGEPQARLALVVTLAGLLAAFAITGTAHAGEDGVVVRYYTSELQDGRLAGNLYARLENAAERSCAAAPRRLPLARLIAERECVAEALERAVTRLDSPVLSSIHQARSDKTRLARR
jgi:UrcA family protein